jgi:hypothetical protein
VRQVQIIIRGEERQLDAIVAARGERGRGWLSVDAWIVAGVEVIEAPWINKLRCGLAGDRSAHNR